MIPDKTSGSPSSAGGIPPTPSAPQAPPPQVEAEETPATQAVPLLSEPAAPRGWPWLRQSIAELARLCKRESELTPSELSDNIVVWQTLATDAGRLARRLDSPPAIELQSIKHGPLSGQEEAHRQATEILVDTMALINRVSDTAVGTGVEKPHSLLRLCGEIAVGVIAILGGVAVGVCVPGAGPFLAVVVALMGVGIIAQATHHHLERNEHAAQFQAAKELLRQLQELELAEGTTP